MQRESHRRKALIPVLAKCESILVWAEVRTGSRLPLVLVHLKWGRSLGRWTWRGRIPAASQWLGVVLGVIAVISAQSPMGARGPPCHTARREGSASLSKDGYDRGWC